MILNDVQVISNGGTIADASWKDDGGEEGPGTDPGEGEKPGEGDCFLKIDSVKLDVSPAK